LVVVTLVVLVASGCGRDNETTDAAPEGETTTTAAAADAQGLDAGAFGDLGVICQPGDGDAAPADGADPGVTADSIQIGTFSDPGFSGRLGLNQELFDTAEAFTKWCNEKGGIHGRTIDLKLRDAKLTEFQQRVIEACDEGDFLSVGGGAVFDDTGQADRLACGLPVIPGYLVTATAADADLALEPVPLPGDEQPFGHLRYLAEKYPDTIENVGIFTGSLDTTIAVANRNKEAMEANGFKIVYEGQYNPQGETSWRTFIEAQRSAGVKGLYWVGEPANLAAFLTEAASVGMTYDWVTADANHYDPAILDAGAAAQNLYVRTVFYPFLDEEQAKENPATEQYRELINQYDEGGKIAALGAQGLSSWLLFAKAANECGAELTRDCVWEKASAITEWTGGGLHAKQNLETQCASECVAVVTVVDGNFQLVDDLEPNDGIYQCDPKNVVALMGDYGTGAKCPNPAFADDPKPSNCANG
jgi:ABC-type branched-subunit amino acid transport system substrate-binding protein